ncbi:MULTISPECIES: tol-pal system-associated acyl-CoA thioesterase [Methylosinus]|uniref:Tol-pal system-associated acyl-CoA thioesterase n=1 Tax=Methylosinus trichosporium (strain ATCC 35070 / NCIMB 11131 / UNIQEM 75 / OB3b) TaxID=595536 RepID=A0A2D2CV28_METT3|nr:MULTISPECIES: tol-pal system-associated acyl-CoA thioesterase [Methylosinus]ATQ66577.1 tol-pal system-associated acyl-CoA thioesterase [Methylosinus trichosporium OB3b]OBS54468.1 tol-pal system-associated acyl-CoA thioesterase [Methylosinus sp. 3S-1]
MIAPVPHRLSVRVYYEDTDFSGLVYHASHLRFMERGRTELLRDLGIFQRALLESPGGGLFFVVRAITIDFRRPALMDDLLTVETRVEQVAGASVDLAQRVLRGEEPLVTALVKVAAVEGGKARRLPADVRQKFESALAPAAPPP